jgi:DMSO/TMAO reductase YedYZ molybdopterin-dependent catalytic subunit
VAGAIGAVVALGVAEFLQSLSGVIPSVPVAASQRIIELTPGALATAGIETAGKAATPILITGVVVFAVALCAWLAVLSLRSPLLALLGACALVIAGLAAAFAEPVVAPLQTALAVLFSAALGLSVARSLLRLAGSSAREEASGGLSGSPEPFHGRSRRTGEVGTAVDRRGFVLLAGGAAVVGVAAAGIGRANVGRGDPELAGTEPAPLRLRRNDGGSAGPRDQDSGRKEAPLSPKELPPPPADASIEVSGMPGLITPADDFYLIDTAISSPRVDRARWTLNVGGAVDNPFEMSYEDLISMPYREADITLSCVSNGVGDGLVSNGRWTGVLLSDVLAEAGVGRDKITRASEQLVGRSVDGWESGFKTEIALDGREALVAFGLNGSELPLKHGYPVRLVIPGLYGYVSATKWLSEIELTDWGYDAYWIKRGWSKEGPIKTQSRIDTISSGESYPAGKVPVGGVAWAPHRGISKVEVSTDGGESWNEARLAAQLDIDTWRQYVYEWEAKPGEYTVQVRATDGEGETQTAEKASPIPSGATGYHTINVNIT